MSKEKKEKEKKDDIIPFFNTAKEYCISKGYEWEINKVRDRYFKNLKIEDFLRQYIFVVISSGMRNQVAEKIFNKFLIARNLNDIGHEGKRKAIATAMEKYGDWFSELQESEDKLTFLDTLPFIGKITKYHLARNLGIDVAKPDRHLVRLAKRFGYDDVQKMCKEISDKTGERIAVIDEILWRYSNLTS